MNRSRTALIVALAVLLTAAAAGRVGDREKGAAAAAPTAATPAPRVGQVTRIVRPEVRLGSAIVSSTVSLFAGNTLSTNQSGQVWFLLNAKGTSCDTLRNSRLQVHPRSGVIIQFLAGRSYCATQPTGSSAPYGAPYRVLILVSDPVFGVLADKKGNVVKVVLGFVEVSTGGEGAVVVGPGQQVVVPAGRTPLAPTPINLLEDEQASVKRLLGQVPQPSFGRPERDDSPVLNAIFERQALIVAVDEPRISDKGTRPFVKSFLEFLSKSWELRPKVVFTSLGQAAKDLGAGRVDAVVTPDAAKLGDAGTVPFFTDARGTTWQLAVTPDEVFLDSLRAFLTAALQTRVYGARYEASFGKAPSYTALRSLLFP